jgi:hypothetical protein
MQYSLSTLTLFTPCAQVRPSFSEISLRQTSWSASARDHMLASYKEAMISIMLRQFDKSKGFKDGMQARVTTHGFQLVA